MIPHPAFLYNLPFILAKPFTQKQIKDIKMEILKWDGTNSGTHNMGGVGFYFNKKEFGHIHWNGDLDIVFGNKLTNELLNQDLVQQHRFVPDIAITFKLNSKSNIPTAIFLLRLAYLRAVKKKTEQT